MAALARHAPLLRLVAAVAACVLAFLVVLEGR